MNCWLHDILKSIAVTLFPVREAFSLIVMEVEFNSFICMLIVTIFIWL